MTLLILDVSVIYLYGVVSDRKGNIMLQKLYVFFRKETVLSIAVILAILSMFWVRPDKAYFTYIDFRTLGLLFCLMAIVAGLKAVGVFDILAKKLLMGTCLLYTSFFKTCRGIIFIIITINEQIQNIAQKKDTLCRRMYN